MIRIALAALWILACDGEGPAARMDGGRGELERAAPEKGPPLPAPTTAGARPSGEYVGGPVKAGGTITGRVLWEGPRPRSRPLRVDRSPEVCGRNVPFPALVVGRDGGVEGAVVSLHAIREGAAASTEALAVVDQDRCRYAPHVVTVVRGGTIEFQNSDELLHNVHADWVVPERRPWFNLASAGRGLSIRRPVEQTGVARVVCDAGHPWMLAYVHSFAHPYHAVTGADGRFRLADVPAGPHEVRMWHEGWRIVETLGGRPEFSAPVEETQTVTVSAGQDTAIEFKLSEP